MSGEWFQCVCQFFQAQSGNLQTVLQGLSNQNTISDIGGSMDDLPTLQDPSQITPMQVFMLFLAVIWAYMFLFSQNKKAETEKPANPNKDNGGNSNDGAPSGGNGGGAGLAQ